MTTYEKLVINYFSFLYICLYLDEVCIFWDFGTLGFGVRPPGLPKTITKTISRPQPHKSIKGINGPPQHLLYYASRPQEYLKINFTPYFFFVSSQGSYMYKNDKWTTSYIWITCEKYISIFIFVGPGDPSIIMFGRSWRTICWIQGTKVSAN